MDNKASGIILISAAIGWMLWYRGLNSDERDGLLDRLLGRSGVQLSVSLPASVGDTSGGGSTGARHAMLAIPTLRISQMPIVTSAGGQA